MVSRTAQSGPLRIAVLFLCLVSACDAFQVSHRVSRPGLHSSYQKPTTARTSIGSLPSNSITSTLSMSGMPDYSGADKMERKIEGRRKRVVFGYAATTIGYLVTVSLILANRAAPYYATGPFMAAWISCILIGASNSDRLWNETYKRLNLCLAFYGATGLAVTYLLPRSRTPAWYVPSAIALINSIKGYTYGLKGWDKFRKASPFRDIVDGFRSNLDSLDKVPNWKSGVYLAATITVGVMKLSKLIDMVELAQAGELVQLGTRLSRFAKLCLLAAVTFTLKEAADRDELEGITYIELNFVASVVFGTLSSYLYQGANAITPLFAAITGYSAFTAAMGIVSIWRKKNQGTSSWLT